MVYENHVISDHTLEITDVIPVTICAVRNYPAWVIVKIQTAQGVEGIGEGFTWAGQAGSVANYISLDWSADFGLFSLRNPAFNGVFPAEG